MSLKMKMAAAALLYLSLTACTTTEEANKEKKEQAAQRQTERETFNIKAIELPDVLYHHSTKKGAYEITVQINGEPQNCVANVNTAAHGSKKNVILTNCRPQ